MSFVTTDDVNGGKLFVHLYPYYHETISFNKFYIISWNTGPGIRRP